MKELHPLIRDLKENGKDPNTTWYDYAVKYKIRVEGSKIQREEAARNKWRKFNRKNLVTVKETYKEGELVYEVKSLRKDNNIPSYNEEGMTITKVVKTPFGDPYVTFEKGKEENSINLEDIQKRIKGINLIPNLQLKSSEKKGLITLSDFHAGAFIKSLEETLLTPDYSLNILEQYLQEVSNKINNYCFKEVRIQIPGDLIESFTAFNHSDSWKSIEKHSGEIVIAIYELLVKFLSTINNLKVVYMVEGNHDRITKQKEQNSRKGIVELVSYFINQNVSSYKVTYHPFILSFEYDGLFNIVTHGDFKPYKKTSYNKEAEGKFLFEYGKQEMFNVLYTGHYHGYSILSQSSNYLHVQAPSIFTGNFYSESNGWNNVPGFLVTISENNLPKIIFEPLVIRKNE